MAVWTVVRRVARDIVTSWLIDLFLKLLVSGRLDSSEMVCYWVFLFRFFWAGPRGNLVG